MTLLLVLLLSTTNAPPPRKTLYRLQPTNQVSSFEHFLPGNPTIRCFSNVSCYHQLYSYCFYPSPYCTDCNFCACVIFSFIKKEKTLRLIICFIEFNNFINIARTYGFVRTWRAAVGEKNYVRRPVAAAAAAKNKRALRAAELTGEKEKWRFLWTRARAVDGRGGEINYIWISNGRCRRRPLHAVPCAEWKLRISEGQRGRGASECDRGATGKERTSERDRASDGAEG